VVGAAGALGMIFPLETNALAAQDELRSVLDERYLAVCVASR
jgi:hypothetical protein